MIVVQPMLAWKRMQNDDDDWSINTHQPTSDTVSPT